MHLRFRALAAVMAAVMLFSVAVLIDRPRPASAAALTYTVVSTGATTGLCPTNSTCQSLRQAINSANANAGADTINFDIAGTSVHVIDETTLPHIAEAVTINGFCATCDGATANSAALFSPINAIYRITVDGPGGTSDGLVVDSPTAVTIRGLNIRNYGGSAITIKQGTGHVIQGNFIGTNETGTAKSGTNGALIKIHQTTTNVQIGGSSPSARNLLSGSGTQAISNASVGTVTSGLSVRGNYVGTNAAGSATIPNSSTAIVTISTGLQVGGTAAGEGNLISGNGIAIQVGPPGAGLIQGNRIGTDATGNFGLGNTKGILVQTSGVGIGGTAAGAGNLISATTSEGVDITLSSSIDVLGNTFGTNLAGTAPLPNRGKQVRVFSSNAVDIGGFVAGAGNRFGGDTSATGTGVGISIEGTSSEARVVNNNIGLGSGGQALGHKSFGILSESSGNDLTIQGNTVVSGGNDGVRVLPLVPVTGLSITGNFIGETPTGLVRGNAGSGVSIGRATGILGGTAANTSNVVAHNGADGVSVVLTGTKVTMSRNRIFDNGDSPDDIGIDLEDDGPSSPDNGDLDDGANGRLNTVEMDGTIFADGNRAFVPILFRNLASTTFRLETYRNTVCKSFGSQGEFYLGDDTVTTGANGITTKVLTVEGLSANEYFAQLTFDAAGNTSEFQTALTDCNRVHRPPQDVDCNFEITALDALAAMNRLAAIDSGPQAEVCATDPALSPGDADGDGNEDIDDILAIRRYLAGLEDIFGDQVQN